MSPPVLCSTLQSILNGSCRSFIETLLLIITTFAHIFFTVYDTLKLQEGFLIRCQKDLTGTSVLPNKTPMTCFD